MNFIELYCEKSKAPVLINLNKVEFIATGEGDEYHLVVFGFNDGKVMVHIKNKDALSAAMKEISQAVFK